MKILRRRKARPAALALAALALPSAVLAVSGWMVLGRGSPRSIDATVRAFFEARHDGDCDRLVELLSEDSWSEGGQLDRDEFLEQCEAVVDDYGPELAAVEVASGDDEEALVQVAVDDAVHLRPGFQQGIQVTGPDEADLAYESGHLVREDGEWKVETDHLFLRLGRSVEQTVLGFVDAYNDSDCEHLVDHVSERVWSDDGERSQDEYLDQCAEESEARRVLPDRVAAVGEPDGIDVAVDPDSRDAARARWVVPSLLGAPTESVTLVKEGLEWKLDGALQAVEQIDLATRLVLDAPWPGFRLAGVEPVHRGSEPSGFVELSEGSDVAERRSLVRFERGVAATFQVDDDDTFTGATVALYGFADDPGARTYAEQLADRVGQQAHSRSPAPLPSVAEVRGAVMRCDADDDSCQHAGAAVGVTVDGRFLVVVEVVDHRYPAASQLLVQVEEMLNAQLDRL